MELNREPPHQDTRERRKEPLGWQRNRTIRLTTKTKHKDSVQTANNAASILDNKEFKSAIEAVEKQYLDALLCADPTDDVSRFRYAEAIKVVRLVSRQLRIAVENGKLSTAALKDFKEGSSFF